MDVLSKLHSSLASRYEIEREIGAGGMATVYLARDPRAFRVVRRDTLLTQMPNANIFGATCDVARDGRIVTLFSDRNNFELVVSPNWITEFRQRIAASERTTRR